jgi:hypothetical protein
VVPATRVVQQPEAVDELVELVEVTRLDPVVPGQAQVLEVGGHRRQRLLPAPAGQVLPLPPGEVGEVGGVGPTGGSGKLGQIVEAFGRVLADGLQHHHPRLSRSRVGLPDQALVDQGGQAVQDVEVRPGQPVELGGHHLHGLEPCAGEHREQLEQPLLARVEHLVTPADCVTQRLLPDGRVARSAPQ